MLGCYSRFVVTARHCTETLSIGQLTVTVGEHDRRVNDGERVIGVRREIPHPDGCQSAENCPWADITLLELSEDLVFSPTIRPVCLPTDTSVDYEGVPGMRCRLF